jgi:spermidine/putrescine-binding protein
VKLSTIVTMLICLLLGIFIGVGVTTVFIKMDESTNKTYVEQQQPKKIVVITFDQIHQEEFFAQIRKFAEKWAYAIRIAPTELDGDVYLIQMWREDIKIIAVNNYDPGRYSMTFLDTYPARPVPEKFFEEEVGDLESFIRDIPDAEFSVEK